LAGYASTRIEVFVDDPDSFIERALATGGGYVSKIENQVPWGTHRQGGFKDPFGQNWSVGDKTLLKRHSE